MKAYQVSFRWDFSEYDQNIGYYLSKGKPEEIGKKHDKLIKDDQDFGCSDAFVKEIEIEGDIPSEIKDVEPNTTVKT